MCFLRDLERAAAAEARDESDEKRERPAPYEYNDDPAHARVDRLRQKRQAQDDPPTWEQRRLDHEYLEDVADLGTAP